MCIRDSLRSARSVRGTAGGGERLRRLRSGEPAPPRGQRAPRAVRAQGRGDAHRLGRGLLLLPSGRADVLAPGAAARVTALRRGAHAGVRRPAADGGGPGPVSYTHLTL